MKVIKYWKVQLLQLSQPSSKLPGIINAHALWSKACCLRVLER